MVADSLVPSSYQQIVSMGTTSSAPLPRQEAHDPPQTMLKSPELEYKWSDCQLGTMILTEVRETSLCIQFQGLIRGLEPRRKLCSGYSLEPRRKLCSGCGVDLNIVNLKIAQDFRLKPERDVLRTETDYLERSSLYEGSEKGRAFSKPIFVLKICS